ncbi:type IV secretory system conjugative DNA transfer family protein [Erwinia psidii]|uniref:type IV secretory system conjugative DNA transfer family protein n=1 Tax=Erwinia psidii TaxID=69224 RepID=UPI00226BA9BD|nr:type IV secretory system conjugative DNA transfer family protein [Erwinia psidii]
MKNTSATSGKLPEGWELRDGRPIQTRIAQYPALLLGKDPYSDNFLASYGQTYMMLAAPPGSGKDVGIVIPNMLSYPHSVVLNDVKFESWYKTAGFRHACGQKVLRFSPGMLETHHWNPFRAIRQDALWRLGDLRTMASSLYVPDNEKNASWFVKAGNIFVAICLFIIETDGEYPLTLPQVYEIGSLGAQLGIWAQREIDERSSKGKPLSDETVRELNMIVSESKSKDFATLVGFLTPRLAIYGEKTVALALTESKNPAENIDFSRMREELTTVYFCVTEGEMKKFAPLMNLFYSQAIRENSKVIPEQGGHCEDGSLRLKFQLLFLMNEFAIMKRIEVMETAPALSRGAGLRFLIVFQNEMQVCANDCYGKEGGNALMKTFHNVVVFSPGDIDASTAYSKRLGTTTVRVPSDNAGLSDGQRRSRGRSWTLQPRPLMLPQEIDALPYEDEIIFMAATEKTPKMNIKAKKIMWYKEKIFQERADVKLYPLPDVPVGNPEHLKGMVKSVVKQSQTLKMAKPQGDDILKEKARRERVDAPQINNQP